MKLLTAFLLILLFLIVPVEAEPIWSQKQEFIPSGSQYSPGTVYSFQIVWSGSNESYTVSSVLFESNFPTLDDNLVNTTVSSISGNIYQINFSSLPTKNYVYRWYAVDNESNWNYTDQFSYSIIKNSSAVVSLYLNGVESNGNYNLNDMTNFTALLNIPNKLINLSSTYDGFVEQTGLSIINNLTNLSSPGYFSLTAYWNGDENYTGSSKTFYFENIPPRYSDMSVYPMSPITFYPKAYYTFSVTWSDIALNRVWFESNHTGSFVNYTSPTIQNNSGNFFITLMDLPARDFAYRWIADDSLGKINSTSQNFYYISKAFPLKIEVVPSKNVVNGTETTVICLSVTDEVTASNFKLYRNSILIENNTLLRRTDEQFLNVGVYEYRCNNTETQNFTNQTIISFLNVSLEASLLNLTKTLNLAGPDSIQINLGESTERNFYLENNLGEPINNISLTITGVPLSWYNLAEIATSIPNNFSLLIRITFNAPSDVNRGNYNVTLRATARTLSNVTKIATKYTIFSVGTTTTTNLPPIYSIPSINTTSYGNLAQFSLKWNDDVELSGFIFSSNISGAWVNDSWTPFSGTESLSYAFKNLTLQPNSIIAWKVYANDSINQWTDSGELYVQVTEREKADIALPIILVSVFVVCLAVLMLFITRKKSKPKVKKENVVYVYRKEDLK